MKKPVLIMSALGLLAGCLPADVVVQTDQREKPPPAAAYNAARRDLQAFLKPGNDLFQLSVANSLWVDDSLDADPAFLQTNADFYRAAVRAHRLSTDQAVRRACRRSARLIVRCEP